jgi:hypothetical protein
MAQYTSEDKEISDLDSHETEESSESVEFISVGASNDDLESYVHKRFKDLQLEDAPSDEEYNDDFFVGLRKRYLHRRFLSERGKIYEEALGKARPLDDTRSEAEREEYVKRIEDLLVWDKVYADFKSYRQGQPACGRIECWAAGQKFVNIVVALLRRRGADDPNSGTEGPQQTPTSKELLVVAIADDPNSGTEGPQPTPISKELLVLAIAAENNDLKMVEALEDIAVAEESFKSSRAHLHPRHEDLFESEWTETLYTLDPLHRF